MTTDLSQRVRHGYLLHGDMAPVCIYCGIPFTVFHILFECLLYDEHRTFHLHSMLYDILGDDCSSVSSILALLNCAGLAK
jgi:hypothetical protein